MVGTSQVGDDGRLRISWPDVKYITLGHPAVSKLPCVGVVPDLQHTFSDVIGMTGEKTFNIVPVNGLAPIKAKDAANGCNPP